VAALSLDGSVSPGLTAVDVEYLAGDERSQLKTEDPVDDIVMGGDGGTRTLTGGGLSALPLPIGLRPPVLPRL
jgi:hypothetical protein